MIQNGHPLVDAVAPERGRSRTRDAKVLVQVDEGAYVDPLKVVCVRSISVGTQGYVRVTLENGDDFDVLQHDCDLNKPDTSLVDDVIQRLSNGLEMHYR